MLIKIIDIAIGYIYDRIFANSIRENYRHMPKIIDSYALIKDLQPDKNYPFKVGLYKEKHGHKVVIKIWEGRNRNIHYYDLIHQAEASRVLNILHDRLINKLPMDLKYISTPKFIDFKNEKNRLIFVSEYIVGYPLGSIKSDKTQWEYYQKVVNYLNFLGENLSNKELSFLRLRRKTIKDYIKLFPFLVAVAIFEHPNLLIDICKSSLYFLLSIRAFINYNKLAIVHGDLNLKNIYIKGKYTYILDVEQTILTYPEFELVTSLSTLGITPSMRRRLYSEIENQAKKSSDIARRLGLLMINCEIHNLTWNAPNENIIWYRKMLNFGVLLAKYAK